MKGSLIPVIWLMLFGIAVGLPIGPTGIDKQESSEGAMKSEHQLTTEGNETQITTLDAKSDTAAVTSTTLEAKSVAAAVTSTTLEAKPVTTTTLETLSQTSTTGKPNEPEVVKPHLEPTKTGSNESDENQNEIKEDSQTKQKSEPSSVDLEKLEKADDSNFLNIVVLGGFMALAVYVVYHNKRKLMGLMFEGRGSGRNVRYRRLSQREEDYNSEIIY